MMTPTPTATQTKAKTVSLRVPWRIMHNTDKDSSNRYTCDSVKIQKRQTQAVAIATDSKQCTIVPCEVAGTLPMDSFFLSVDAIKKAKHKDGYAHFEVSTDAVYRKDPDDGQLTPVPIEDVHFPDVVDVFPSDAEDYTWTRLDVAMLLKVAQAIASQGKATDSHVSIGVKGERQVVLLVGSDSSQGIGVQMPASTPRPASKQWEDNHRLLVR